MHGNSAKGRTNIDGRQMSAALRNAGICLLFCGIASAQTPPVSVPGTQSTTNSAARSQVPSAQQTSPAPMRPYVATDIAQRPYTGTLPAPLYPSSPRKQSQFTVQYIYNYARSTYTPAVTLPVLSRGTAKHDTPEATLIAFYSAMRSGDYEGWLQCWDEPSRKALEAKTKLRKEGAEYWRALWRRYYANKRIMLVDRLETVNYIILDTQMEDPANPGKMKPDSDVLVGSPGQWFVTDQFTNDGMVMNLDPGAPTAKVTKQFEIAPVSELVGPATLTGQAQRDFFAHHTVSSSLTKTME